MEETKTCIKCGRTLPITSFYVEGGIRRGDCKECRAEYRKQWRKQNHKLYLAQAKRRQDRQTDWLHSMKKLCVVCGESEPVAIDFHHINPNEKDFTIGKNRGRSKEWLSEEIAKCVCLCANCHRKVHARLINIEDYINNESPT